MPSAAARIGLAAAFGLAWQGCKGDGDPVLLVKVELRPAGSYLGAVKLHVTVQDARDQAASHDFAARSGELLSFPTSFTLQLSRSVHSPLRLEVAALDPDGAMVALGSLTDVTVKAGDRRETTVLIDCLRGCPAVDGVDAGVADAAADARNSTGTVGACGNGQIDRGELCDWGIPPGRPGACPPENCDDGIPCTNDRVVVAGTRGRCSVTCEHTVIDSAKAGDGCCPAGASVASDTDCSPSCGNNKRDQGETCDSAIPDGRPEACPSEASCADQDPCTTETLISGGTCAAVCLREPILIPRSGDGCCPPGGSNASDSDCPVVCGNGTADPGESCDRGAAAGSDQACRTSCDDGDPCTSDVLVGSACQAACKSIPISQAVSGDKCCPPGGNRVVDADCTSMCDNGVFEPGEACDSKIPAGQPGACPTTCPAAPPNSCFSRVVQGRPEECAARCEDEAKRCGGADGCCPTGCTSASDPDCSATCGNGLVDPGETCDVAIAAAAAGACPIGCGVAPSCNTVRLVSPGTCQAHCETSPITRPASGDGCCPPGANGVFDNDCPAVCGNGLVEWPREFCDKAVPAGSPGACLTDCPELPPGCSKARLVGDADSCTRRCTVEAVGECKHDDGCCPAGCRMDNDHDCPPVCGNGALEAPEICDRGISAGYQGACPASCDDQDACTADVLVGRISDCTRTCKRYPIQVCRSGDRCCPPGCTATQDGDCRTPSCGDMQVFGGETCDPPTLCPTECPDDGDPCTRGQLVGDPRKCNSYCGQVPIKTCSGVVVDQCCPTGCSGMLDVDCTGPPPRATP